MLKQPNIAAACIVGLLFCTTAIAEPGYGGRLEGKNVGEASHKTSLTGEPLHQWAGRVKELCRRVGRKLGSVSIPDCLDSDLQSDGTLSHGGLPMALAEYPPIPEKRKPKGRVLVLGGIHGDEYSAVSIVFHWMKILKKYHTGMFHWRVAPVSNPDGLLRPRSQRMNSKGVDLNRNFPTVGWGKEAPKYWKNTGHNKRRYPGGAAGSEPETRWIMRQIEKFQPDVIVQIHAPYGIVDFDGAANPPKHLGRLHLNLLGTYPGSLGNYGGNKLDIPVLTVELPSAGVLPSRKEQAKIWVDMVRWLRGHLPRESSKPVKTIVADDLKTVAETSSR